MVESIKGIVLTDVALTARGSSVHPNITTSALFLIYDSMAK